jgi:hypothetical protein
MAKKEKRLQKAGYKTKKGIFQLFQIQRGGSMVKCMLYYNKQPYPFEFDNSANWTDVYAKIIEKINIKSDFIHLYNEQKNLVNVFDLKNTKDFDFFIVKSGREELTSEEKRFMDNLLKNKQRFIEGREFTRPDTATAYAAPPPAPRAPPPAMAVAAPAPAMAFAAMGKNQVLQELKKLDYVPLKGADIPLQWLQNHLRDLIKHKKRKKAQVPVNKNISKLTFTQKRIIGELNRLKEDDEFVAEQIENQIRRVKSGEYDIQFTYQGKNIEMIYAEGYPFSDTNCSISIRNQIPFSRIFQGISNPTTNIKNILDEGILYLEAKKE